MHRIQATLTWTYLIVKKGSATITGQKVYQHTSNAFNKMQNKLLNFIWTWCRAGLRLRLWPHLYYKFYFIRLSILEGLNFNNIMQIKFFETDLCVILYCICIKVKYINLEQCSMWTRLPFLSVHIQYGATKSGIVHTNSDLSQRGRIPGRCT